MHPQDKDAARYRQLRAMLLGFRFARYVESLPHEPLNEQMFDAAMDAAIELEKKEAA